MESSPLSYGTFEAITLQSPSIYTIAIMCKDWYRNSGPRAKVSVLWIILASGYVIAFSTLVSAMTGIVYPDGSLSHVESNGSS